MSTRIIYVICYDDESEKKAIDDFQSYSWARIYRIPAEVQNHLFEGVMYQTELMKLYDEWKDKEFVGTISYKLKDRFAWYPYRSMETINLLISTIKSEDYNVVPFMPFIGGNFQELNTDLRNVYKLMCDFIFPLKNIYSVSKSGIHTHELDFKHENFFFFNYWMTTPSKMLEYISFFNTKWLPVLETLQNVWNNSNYNGKLTPKQLKSLTKRVEYYPYHPFINERLPASYFRYNKSKIFY